MVPEQFPAASTHQSDADKRVAFSETDRAGQLPLTPPPEKQSVSFDLLPPCVDSENETQNKTADDLSQVVFVSPSELQLSPLPSIPCLEMPDDMLVALKDRESEMRDLVLLNKDYFELVRHSIASDEDWQMFERLLYAPRVKVSDREWISDLCVYLRPNPPLLERFREMVGLDLEVDLNEVVEELSDADESDGENYDPLDGNDSEVERFWGMKANPGDGEAELRVIREYPEKLAEFETAYPEFFDNVQRCLSRESRLGAQYHNQHRRNSNGFDVTQNAHNDEETVVDDDYEELDEPNEFLRHPRHNICARDLCVAAKEENEQACEDSQLYESFREIFFMPRRVMPDDQWEAAVYEALDNWPDLIDALRGIIAYEVAGEDCAEEIPAGEVL